MPKSTFIRILAASLFAIAALLTALAPVAHADSFSVDQHFTDFYASHGGVRLIGLPISGVFNEVSSTDGKTYLVQYFERNRLEYHPENQGEWTVLAGLLGVDAWKNSQHGQYGNGMTDANASVVVGPFRAWGTPANVNTSNIDLGDPSIYKSTITGAAHILQEPGKLGLIDPGSNDVFRFNPPATQPLWTGSFQVTSLGWGLVQLDNVTMNLGGEPGSDWILVVRGYNDHNAKVNYLTYDRGEVNTYNTDPRLPIGGFYSENEFKQVAKGAHKVIPNCNLGCSRVYAVLLEKNTEALSVLKQTGDGGNWELLYSNWYK